MKSKDKKHKWIDLSSSLMMVLLISISLAATTSSMQSQNIFGEQTPTAKNTTALTSTSSQSSAENEGSILKLSRSNIPIDIPMMKGYQNGHEIFFIATDASDKQTAAVVTNQTGFKVNISPVLSKTPESFLNQAYGFTNGISGSGPFGFQLPVVAAKPGDQGFSPLWKLNLVEWNQNATPRELKSAQEIMAAQQNGSLTIKKTDVVVNHPVIKWDGGSLKIKEDKNVNDDSPYVGGQVLNIDTKNMVVTMVAHRGWGPDGRTLYYIVTDATPKMPADMMGVAYVPAEEKLTSTPVTVDLFQFMNGINGSGPMGFQAGIGAANNDDANYSPIWRISFIDWKDPLKARVLETVNDITAMAQAGMISITPAMNGTHVVNCPFFEPSTVFEHQDKPTTEV
jgi:hypothetical protein